MQQGIMNQQSKHIKNYKEVQLSTASQGRIIVMLYDEVIRQIEYARDELQASSRKYDKINAALVKARDVITELMVSLDFEKGDALAKSLFSLYQFFNTKLIEANVKKEVEPLNEIYPFISDLRESWNKISTTAVASPEVPSSGIDISG